MLKQQQYTLTNVKKVKIAINHPFKQGLDHFNYNSFGNGTYDQRYLITGDNLPHYHTVKLLSSF